MGLGASLRDSVVWHRRCADAIDLLGTTYAGTAVGVDIGSAQRYTITPSIGIGDSLIAGERFRFTPDTTNTDGPVQLIVGTISQKAVVKNDGLGTTPLSPNDMPAGIIAEVQYTGSNFVLVSEAVTDGEWTSTLGAASGTYTTTTKLYARFDRRQGNWVRVLFAFHGTTSATPAYLTFTLPFLSATLGANQQGFATVQDGASVLGICSIQDNSTECRVYRSDLANFGTGAGRGAYCNFSYLAA